METKAAVLYEMGAPQPYVNSKPLKIERLKLASPGFEEVLVQIKAAGVCHSDLSVINGNRPRPLPMALGHEASGVVLSLGPAVKNLKVGDHVVFAFLPSCGHCKSCNEGKAALCEPGAQANGSGTLIGGDIRIQKDNTLIHHHLGVSGFAEKAVASIHSLVKIDPDLSFDIAALFGCAVLTGVGAVINTAQLRLGQSILIIGLGGVGLSAVLGALAAGATKVIVSDVNPSKREVALKLGAHIAIDPTSSNALEALIEETDGGVDVAVEFAGAIAALDFAYKATKRGGMTVTGALPAPDAKWSISPVSLVGQEKTIKGSYLGSCVPSRDIPAFIELYKTGRLAVDKLISHRTRLKDINAAMDRLASGEALRQIIMFD